MWRSISPCLHLCLRICRTAGMWERFVIFCFTLASVLRRAIEGAKPMGCPPRSDLVDAEGRVSEGLETIRFHGNPWTSMDIHRNQWISMDIHAYLCIDAIKSSNAFNSISPFSPINSIHSINSSNSLTQLTQLHQLTQPNPLNQLNELKHLNQRKQIIKSIESITSP